ncbi:MAG: HD domain-containing phosphohydrolase [Candidatus Nitrotoga sp.]
MSKKSELHNVNPHYLERVVDLNTSYDVSASEDIFDANGMKLLAKGAKIASGVQEKLIRHKLKKPLENSIALTDGVTIDKVVEIAKQLLEEVAPLKLLLDSAPSKIFPIDPISRISLNSSTITLLTMAYNSEGQRAFKHTVMVALISTILGIRSKCSSDEISTVAHAGLLHDVGEMYLAPEYLKSAAHLKPEDWKYVVVHPKVGQLVLQEFTTYPSKVARAVGEHHERLDGSGYPDQVIGNKISREGAIVAAAEALGGIFMNPNSPLQRATMAMRIVPGEFAADLVSLISSTAQSSSLEVQGSNRKPLSELAPNLQNLHDKLLNTMSLCETISVSPLVKNNVAYLALQQVVHRIQVIKRSLASSGVGSCLLEPHLVLSEVAPEILLELEVVSRELQWRLRDIARELFLRLYSQGYEVSGLFSELINALDILP